MNGDAALAAGGVAIIGNGELEPSGGEADVLHVEADQCRPAKPQSDGQQ
jgi:hypothetical protein